MLKIRSRLTYNGTGLDLEVDKFDWIRYIEIVQYRSRLDQIVDSIIFFCLDEESKFHY